MCLDKALRDMGPSDARQVNVCVGETKSGNEKKKNHVTSERLHCDHAHSCVTAKWLCDGPA